jgi:hypothetical protein
MLQTRFLHQCFPVIPRHPLLRTAGHQLAVFLQRGQVVEGIGIAELARVDEAHEEVANVSPVLGLIEEMFVKELANEGCVAVDDYPVPVVQLCFHTGSVAESLLERKSFL